MAAFLFLNLHPDVRVSLHKILEHSLRSERVCRVFAQIYDGHQTIETLTSTQNLRAIHAGDFGSPSEAALHDSRTWLAIQSVENLVVDPSAQVNLNTDELRLEFVSLVAVPAFRELLRAYCSHLYSDNVGMSTLEAVQNWGEEVIFGGRITRINDKVRIYSTSRDPLDHTAYQIFKLLVKPTFHVAFTVTPSDVIFDDHGLVSLPFQPPTIRKPYPRLEDDRGIMEWINRYQS